MISAERPPWLRVGAAIGRNTALHLFQTLPSTTASIRVARAIREVKLFTEVDDRGGRTGIVHSSPATPTSRFR
jgi:hypothetical protein